MKRKMLDVRGRSEDRSGMKFGKVMVVVMMMVVVVVGWCGGSIG